jgi:Predicted transcriptional regulators
MPKQDYFEKGQLTDLAYLVLASLTKPRHGYMIMQQIDHLTAGEISIGPASLYTTLKKLTDAGYIGLVSDEERKKTYHITHSGLENLEIEIKKRESLAYYGKAALKEFKEDTQ